MIALGLSIDPPSFDDPGDSHAATQWQIMQKGVNVYDSGELTADLLGHAATIPEEVNGRVISRGNQVFYVRYRVKGTVTGWSGWSGYLEFSVALGFKPPAAFEIGPIERATLIKGLSSRLWRLEFRDKVYLNREAISPDTGWRTAVELFEPDNDLKDISELSFTFDQSGRPVVFYEVAGNIKGYYYDGVEGRFDVWDVGAGRTPRARLDYRWNGLLPTSDIILFYIRVDGALCYRLQSDRYSAEYESGLTGFSSSYLKQVDNTQDNRLCLTYITEGAGCGNAGASGPCYTFGFCVSDVYYADVWHVVDTRLYDPEKLDVASEIRSGSRRVIMHEDTAIPEEVDIETIIASASRRIVMYERTPAAEEIDLETTIQSGSRREVLFAFPFDSQKDPYYTPADLAGVDPESLSATEKQGLELVWIESSVQDGSRREAMIEVTSYNPYCARIDVETSIIGGSRRVV